MLRSSGYLTAPFYQFTYCRLLRFLTKLLNLDVPVCEYVCVCLCVPFLILLLTQFLHELWPRVTWCEVSLVIFISVHVKPANVVINVLQISSREKRRLGIVCWLRCDTDSSVTLQVIIHMKKGERRICTCLACSIFVSECGSVLLHWYRLNTLRCRRLLFLSCASVTVSVSSSLDCQCCSSFQPIFSLLFLKLYNFWIGVTVLTHRHLRFICWIKWGIKKCQLSGVGCFTCFLPALIL